MSAQRETRTPAALRTATAVAPAAAASCSARVAGAPGQRSAAAAGFTLIELIVVLAVVALVMGAATVSLRSVMQSELRSAAARTAGALAAAFDRAAMSGRTVRVAIDLERGSLWLETAGRGVALGASPVSADGRDVAAAAEEAEAAGEGEGDQDEREGGASGRSPQLPFGFGGAAEDEAPAGIDPAALLAAHERDLEPVRRPKPRFRAVKGAAGARQALGRGVRIEAVLTPRLVEPQTKGIAYIHCFAQGLAEPAAIVLRSGEDSFYSVTLHPLSGRARVHACRVPLPRDFGDEEAAALLDGQQPCEGS